MRKWLNVELNNVESEAFRGALKANKIKYEASNCGYGLTHFEVFVNTSEIDILEGKGIWKDPFLFELKEIKIIIKYT